MSHTAIRLRSRGLAAAAAALALVLTGCSSGSSDSAGSGKQTVVFWGWSDMSKPVALWNKTHPDIHVKFQAITSNFYPKLQAAITGKDGAPDITQVDYPNLTSTIIAGDLKDITAESADLKPHFKPAVWDQVVVNDKVYGVPQDIGTQVLYYRSDVFKEAGLTAPKTWDEYMAAAAKLKKAHPKAYTTAFPANGGAWLASLAWNAKAQWFGTDKDAWKVDLDDQPTLKVAEYWQKMLDKGYAKGDQHWQPTWFKGLAKGTYLTWIGPAWGGAALKENAPDLSGKWAVAPLPQWTTGDTAPVYWGGSLTALTSVTNKTDAAMKFITWLNTSKESAKLLVADVLPASDIGQGIPELTKPDPYFGGQVPGEVFTVRGTESTPWTWGPTMTDTTNYLNDAMQSVINKSTTLPDAMKKVDGETKSQLKRKGLSVR
ncbi:extracellular solute-binding protein [Streptomyces sp. NPDC059679]|uniref:extracellular solute-binding protein n=1 Tax=Streptomyces sp. NPDC059679 TaxID=3346903 RepID=UPI0036C076D2